VQIHNLCGKARHTTNEEAVQALVRLLMQGVRLDTLRVYVCGFCTTPDQDIFHVGNSLGPNDPLPENRRPKTRGGRRRLRMLGLTD
jgi:hypothetical protein